MDDVPFEPLARLTSVGDLTAAHLLAARLQSEGINAVVRGEPMGPYPMTVGRMAVTEIWVPEVDLDDASDILEEVYQDAENAEIESGGVGVSPNPGVSALWWLVAAVLLGVVLFIRFAGVF